MDNDYPNNAGLRSNPEIPGRIHKRKSQQKISLRKQTNRIFHKIPLSDSLGVVSLKLQIPRRKKLSYQSIIKF